MLKALRPKIRAVVLMGVVGLLGLSGCAAEKPQSSESRNLNSGVTSNNGGGMAPANFGTVTTKVR